MLTEQKKLFVQEFIKLKCTRQYQAAINAGYSPKTAAQTSSKLMKDSEVLDYLKQEKLKLEESLREKFYFEAQDAFKIMQDIMHNPKVSPKYRVEVAKDFLDRAGYKPVEKQQLSGAIEIDVSTTSKLQQAREKKRGDSS